MEFGKSLQRTIDVNHRRRVSETYIVIEPGVGIASMIVSTEFVAGSASGLSNPPIAGRRGS
jgi:hypothetical protein